MRLSVAHGELNHYVVAIIDLRCPKRNVVFLGRLNAVRRIRVYIVVAAIHFNGHGYYSERNKGNGSGSAAAVWQQQPHSKS